VSCCLPSTSLKKAMLSSNTGGDDANKNSSSGAIVGDAVGVGVEGAKGIEESERRLADLFFEGVDGQESFVHGGNGECGGGADVGGDVFGVFPPDETQGYTGGSAKILLRSNIGLNAELFANLQPKLSCFSVIDTSGSVHPNVASPSIVLIGANRETESSVGISTLGDEVVDASSAPSMPGRQYFKKRSRKLCRKLDRRQTCDRKRSSFDYAGQQHSHPTTNRDEVTPPVARCLPNRGHSPTKDEVKRINQRLLDENLRLKRDFHKATHRLKTLLEDKNDLQRRLRLESKTSNNLIESIQAEANDVMKRARDIFSHANRIKKETELLNDEIDKNRNELKKETELLKDEIDKSRNELLDVQKDLRKQSDHLKKQGARMTETHNRRKKALAEQKQQIVNDLNTDQTGNIGSHGSE
jgi:hypothetical protein